jgi:hypothetical protein
VRSPASMQPALPSLPSPAGARRCREAGRAGAGAARPAGCQLLRAVCALVHWDRRSDQVGLGCTASTRPGLAAPEPLLARVQHSQQGGRGTWAFPRPPGPQARQTRSFGGVPCPLRRQRAIRQDVHQAGATAVAPGPAWPPSTGAEGGPRPADRHRGLQELQGPDHCGALQPPHQRDRCVPRAAPRGAPGAPPWAHALHGVQSVREGQPAPADPPPRHPCPCSGRQWLRQIKLLPRCVQLAAPRSLPAALPAPCQPALLAPRGRRGASCSPAAHAPAPPTPPSTSCAPAAIRFVLNDLGATMRAEERQQLLHVSQPRHDAPCCCSHPGARGMAPGTRIACARTPVASSSVGRGAARPPARLPRRLLPPHAA